MTQQDRETIRAERDRSVRETVGIGHGAQTDPTLNRVVWLPTVGQRTKPDIFYAHRQYEGRLAA